MKVDRNSEICGIPIIKIRDFLKCFQTLDFFSLQTISEYFSLTKQSGASLLSELIKAGYITEESKNKYVISIKGNALAQIKFVRRMDKTKADAIFSEFMKRVKKINEDDTYIVRVSKLILFGSYLDSTANDFGDIDIAYELKHKIRDVEAYKIARQRFVQEAKANGKVFSSFFDEISYPETAVLKFLKNRSPYISLHRTDEIYVLEAAHKQIFP